MVNIDVICKIVILGDGPVVEQRDDFVWFYESFRFFVICLLYLSSDFTLYPLCYQLLVLLPLIALPSKRSMYRIFLRVLAERNCTTENAIRMIKASSWLCIG